MPETALTQLFALAVKEMVQQNYLYEARKVSALLSECFPDSEELRGWKVLLSPSKATVVKDNQA